MKIDICKLCQEKKELINKSHIIPKHFYRYTNEQLNKYYDEDVKEIPTLFLKDRKPKQFQNGLYIGGILCKDCENLIGKWDKYAQNLLLKRIDIDSIKQEQDKTGYVQSIQDVDYKQLKLFFMSILFRSYLAKDYSFMDYYTKDEKIEDGKLFQNVNLNNQWYLKLRDMILKENPGNEDDFSIFLIKFTGKESIAKYFKPPIKNRFDGVNLYEFFAGGYQWWIKVDQRLLSKKMKSVILKPDYPLYLYTKNYKDTQDFKNYVQWVFSLPEEYFSY